MTARVTSSASDSLGAIPTAGRQGARCGDAFNRSSVVTYSAVARVSRSASTGPPRLDVGFATPILDALLHLSHLAAWGRKLPPLGIGHLGAPAPPAARARGRSGSAGCSRPGPAVPRGRRHRRSPPGAGCRPARGTPARCGPRPPTDAAPTAHSHPGFPAPPAAPRATRPTSPPPRPPPPHPAPPPPTSRPAAPVARSAPKIPFDVHVRSPSPSGSCRSRVGELALASQQPLCSLSKLGDHLRRRDDPGDLTDALARVQRHRLDRSGHLPARRAGRQPRQRRGLPVSPSGADDLTLERLGRLERRA